MSYTESQVFSGPNGTTKVVIDTLDEDVPFHESYQLINNDWILRDLYHTAKEAIADALWGAGLSQNPSGSELFNVMPLLRNNPSGSELFEILPMLRNPNCCVSCGQYL